jgi:hypothetical protein
MAVRVAAVLALIAVCPQQALATGGSIEAATVVTPGEQAFGNTTNGTFRCGPADFWRLQLTAGDTAIVDWETTQHDYANELYVYPAGTTDFSINNEDPQDRFSIGENNRAESVINAGATGTYPLIFAGRGCNGDGSNAGPYDFTVAVRHVAVLGLGSLGGLKSGAGTVRVGVHTPDGSPVTDPSLRVDFRGTWRGRSHLLGSGSPSDGTVFFTVKLPAGARGRTVSFQAKAHGPGYRNSHTGSKRVKVRR